MDLIEKEKLLRERLCLAADVEIPREVLLYIPVEVPHFTDEELEWGRAVVAGVAQQQRHLP